MDVDEITVGGFVAESAQDVAFPVASITVEIVPVVTFFKALYNTVTAAIGGGTIILADDHFYGAIPVAAAAIFILAIVTLFIIIDDAVSTAVGVVIIRT